MTSIENIIQQLKAERDRISQAIAALESVVTGGNTRTAGRTSTGDKRIVSALARRRMAQAQRARWAKVKSQSPAIQSKPAPKRTMSASARRKIAAAQHARWAKVRTRQNK